MKVKNRSASVAGYTIPDANIRRRFAPGEVKDIPKEEIEKLLYQPGGRELFEDDLQVSAADMAALGFGDQEPEYFYLEEDIKRIMTTGSLDEFLDMLDFAPDGVLNIVKDMAVKLPLADMNKIEAFKKATGFDAGKAIAHNKAVEKDNSTAPATTERKRRVEVAAPVTKEYKIVN